MGKQGGERRCRRAWGGGERRGGVCLHRSLEAGEVAVVDGASIVGFSGSVKMGVKVTNSCLMCCCGSNGISPQGLFSTTLTGPGKIWLQTMSYEKMKNCLMPDKPPAAAGAVGMAASFA